MLNYITLRFLISRFCGLDVPVPKRISHVVRDTNFFGRRNLVIDYVGDENYLYGAMAGKMEKVSQLPLGWKKDGNKFTYSYGWDILGTKKHIVPQLSKDSQFKKVDYFWDLKKIWTGNFNLMHMEWYPECLSQLGVPPQDVDSLVGKSCMSEISKKVLWSLYKHGLNTVSEE